MAGGGSPRTRGTLELRADEVDFTRRVYLPVQRFIQTEWVGSVLLLSAAVVALLWANSPWADEYHHLWETELSLELGLFAIAMDLHHWVNDGLMALFFFVVGLEIKRELLHGNLSDPKEAALPALAALGGMAVPAGIYAALNATGPGAPGWGIPMATDIAFALGVLGLLGRRLPPQLRVFLLALAIVDDLGAIAVIAVFYSKGISWTAMAAAGGLIVALVILRRLGVRSLVAYAVVAFFLWAAVYESGIHATVAGVILGALTPSRPLYDSQAMLERGRDLLQRYGDALERGDHDHAQATLGRLDELTSGTEAPLEQMERTVHPVSAYLVLPLFALANSGVALTGEALAAATTSPVTLGIVGGLIGGKLVGVTSFAWLGVVTGIARLPDRVTWRHVMGTSLLAGIGFTVSLFITELAFVEASLIAEAKMGILAASLVAGIGGWLFLRIGSAEEHPAA